MQQRRGERQRREHEDREGVHADRRPRPLPQREHLDHQRGAEAGPEEAGGERRRDGPREPLVGAVAEEEQREDREGGQHREGAQHGPGGRQRLPHGAAFGDGGGAGSTRTSRSASIPRDGLCSSWNHRSGGRVTAFLSGVSQRRKRSAATPLARAGEDGEVTTTEAAGAETTGASGRRGLVPVLIFIGTVVAVISSLGAPLIPSIAAADHVSLPDAQWSLTLTLLVGAVATPVFGRLGDGPRRRAVMLGRARRRRPRQRARHAAARASAGCSPGGGCRASGWGSPRSRSPPRATPCAGQRARATIAALSVTVAAGAGPRLSAHGPDRRARRGARRLLVRRGRQRGGPASPRAVVFPPSPAPPARPLDVARRAAARAGAGHRAAGAERGRAQRLDAPRWLLAAGRRRRRRARRVGALGAARARRRWSTCGWPGAARRRPRTSPPCSSGSPTTCCCPRCPCSPRRRRPPATASARSVVVAGLILLPFSIGSVLSGRLARRGQRAGRSPRVLPAGALVLGAALALFALEPARICGELFVDMAVAGLGVGTRLRRAARR